MSSTNFHLLFTTYGLFLADLVTAVVVDKCQADVKSTLSGQSRQQTVNTQFTKRRPEMAKIEWATGLIIKQTTQNTQHAKQGKVLPFKAALN